MRTSLLNTRACGIAGGVVCGGCVFLGTLAVVLGAGQGPPPPLLRSVLFGYTVSAAGAFVGALWAYAYGFLAGAVFAFVYNLAAAPEPPPLD